jgi:potassium-transporting ATPase KdpC subunit
MKNIWNTLRMFVWMTLLTGILYPLLITLIAQLTMKKKADGNFIVSNGRIVGAALIAQKFTDDKYFWARPSSIDYNPLPSGGSNLGPTSTDLKKTVDERKDTIIKAQKVQDKAIIPSELLFSSGSGLDPHISPFCAQFQVERIIKARGWNEEVAKQAITQLIKQYTDERRFGFLGEPCINVLRINLALDELAKSQKI